MKAPSGDKPELVVFIGLQGAGKSTFYRERLAKTHVLISKDLWPHARRREARQRARVEEALRQGSSVAVDNTNASVAERAPLMHLGRIFDARIIGYYFASRLEDCLARNAGREGRARVPERAIIATARRLEQPSFREGFDALFYVAIQDGSFSLRPWEEEISRRPLPPELKGLLGKGTLREELAALSHQRWARSASLLATHPGEEELARWRSRMITPYQELSEEEKAEDRVWAERIIAVFSRHLREDP